MATRRSVIALALALTATLGCEPGDPVPCRYAGSPLAWDRTDLLETSAALLVADRAAFPPAVGAWVSGEVTEVESGLSRGSGPPTLQESVTGLNCPARVEIPVVLHVSTDDGGLAENIPATWPVLVEGDRSLDVTVTVLADQLAGEMNPGALAGGPVTTLEFWFGEGTGVVRAPAAGAQPALDLFAW